MMKKDDVFDIEKFKEALYKGIVGEYLRGSKDVTIDSGSGKIVYPDTGELKILGETLYGDIKGVTDEMAQRIKRAIRDSALANESGQGLAQRLHEIFRGDNPTRFRYETRLKTIARTEKTRAFSQGAFSNAKKLGMKFKYLIVIEDERTSGICSEFHNKYGEPEQAIPIDEEFEVMYQGKQYSGNIPPFHPNCRTRVKFLWKEKEK